MAAEESSSKTHQNKIKPAGIDWIEILTFTIYSIIFFCIVTFQLNIPQQYTMNNNIQQHFFYKATNIFIEPYIGPLQTFNWIDSQLQIGYNFESSPVPFTCLRIRQKMYPIHPATGYLDNNGEEFKQDIGNLNQFSYDQNLGAYALFYIPISVQDVNDVPISENLDLITTEYLNKQTRQVLIDTMYYSANLQMIAVVQIEFKFVGGLISKSFSVMSFPSGSYKSNSDQIRFGFEIIFMIMYTYYFVMEGLKIKHQIDQQFQADKMAEKKQRDNILIKEKKIRRENIARKGFIGIEINDKSPYKLQRGSQTLQKAVSNTLVNEASLLKKRLQLIINGLISHLKQIWSTLDVILIILIGVAGVDWIDLQINQQAIWQLENILQNVDNYDDIFLKMNNDQDIKINMINDMMILHAFTINHYRRCVSAILLITSMKLLRYSTQVFPILKNYVDIMVKVSGYLIFYIILIFCIMMGAGYFLYFYYGSAIGKISDPLKSVQNIMAIFMGFNEIQQDMLNYDETPTIIFSIVIYFLVGCLLLNMFFVFVNHELDQSQKKKKQDKSINKDQSILTQKHLFWVLMDFIERIAITSWYTITLRKKDISLYFDDKAHQEQVHQRNFLRNIQLIPYNTNFDGDDCSDEEDEDKHNSESKKSTKNIILGAEQIEIQMHIAKEEFVVLTWYTISLLFLLGFSIIIVQIFAKTEDGRLLSQSIEKKIMTTQAEGNITFANIQTQTDISQWLIKGFPLLFEDILLGKREVQFLYKKADPIVEIDGKSKYDALAQDDYMFDNLRYGSSISYFNLVVNNMCRINIRKSRSGPNPDDSLMILQDTIKLMELSDPKDVARDGTEFTETYINAIFDIPNLVLEYDSQGGQGQVGGYQMVVDIQQVDDLMDELVGIGFLGDDLVTFSLQFLTFNPINMRSFASVVIDLTVSNSGLVIGKKISVDSIYKNSLSIPVEVILIILSILLLIMMFYYYGHILMQMKFKYLAYNRWQKMFLQGMMTESQIWIRQRHKPEFISKAQNLIDVSQFINSVFLMLNSAQISLLLYSFFITNDLTQGTKIFQKTISEFLNVAAVSIEPVKSYDEILLYIDKITKINRITITITSFAFPLLCLNILLVQLRSRESKQILLTFKECMKHFPCLIVIMFQFIIGFTITGHFLLGDQILNFKNFFSSLVEIFNYILHVKNMKFFENDILGMLIILVPFIFIVRFILFNLFLAITYRSYLSSQHRISKMRKPQFQLSVSITDFIQITRQMLSFRVKLPNSNSELYLKKLIKTFQPNLANNQFKDIVRQTLMSARIKIWANTLAEVIQLEVDSTLPLKKTVNDLIQTYVKYNKDGNEGILEKFDSERKYYEFNLFHTYLNYLKTSQHQMEKLISFFQNKTQSLKKDLYGHIDIMKSENINQKDDKEYQVQYIAQLEARLDEALQGMNFLRQEFETIGLQSTKIQFDDSTVQNIDVSQIGITKSGVKDQNDRIKKFKNQNNIRPLQTKDQQILKSKEISKSPMPDIQEEKKALDSNEQLKENPKSSLKSSIKPTRVINKKKSMNIQFEEVNE